MNASWRKIVACSLGLALLALPAHLGAVEYGAATPEELAQRLEAAARDGDMAEMVRCLAPEERIMMVGMMTMMGTMMVAFAAMGEAMAEGLAEGLAEAFEGEMEADVEPAAAAEPAATAPAIAEMEERFQDLFARYGLPDLMAEEDDEEVDFESAFADIDHGAYFADLMAVLSELNPGGDDEGSGLVFNFGEDVSVTVTEIAGDRATALAGDEELSMVRIDGRWYFQDPAAEEGGEGP